MSRQAEAAAKIDFQLRGQVVSLREQGYPVIDICRILELHKSSEWAAVQMICNSKELRRHRKGGPSIAGPVKAGTNRSQRHSS